MKKATDILFHILFNEKPLFKNQTELVRELTNHPKSEYYIKPETPPENTAKAQGRLKTYISQLLSDTVVRGVTEDLKRSMEVLLAMKLPHEQQAAVLNELLTAITEKNNILASSNDVTPVAGSKNALQEDLRKANYISVVTARPIDMDANESEDGFSIKSFFFRDLMLSVQQEIDRAKLYRFNFPSDTYCRIFWLGLEKIMIRALASMDYAEKMELIYSKSFAITTDTISEYLDYYKRKTDEGETDEIVKIGNKIRKSIAREIIERLNRNKIIMVFAIEEPIFTLPFVAINPNESTSKVYALLDFEEKSNLPYKFTPENTLLWRIFVWDKLKATNSGKNIPFTEPAR